MAILAAPVEKGRTISHIMVSGIDLTLLTVAGDPVTLQIAQMGINRFAAHELPPPRAATLRVELDDTRLHRDPARAGADPACIPAPPVPTLQSGSDLRASSARIAPAACLPRSGQLIGVTACPADRQTDLRREALGPMAHGARAGQRKPDKGGLRHALLRGASPVLYATARGHLITWRLNGLSTPPPKGCNLALSL